MFFLDLNAWVAQSAEPSGDHESRRKWDVDAHDSNGSEITSASCIRLKR